MENSYDKEGWKIISIKELKEHLNNYSKIKDSLKNIVGFTGQEYREIESRLIKGEDLVKKVLKDKRDALVSGGDDE